MKLNVLGALELRTDDGHLVTVSAPKRRAILAALALELNQVVTVDRLLALVWNEDPPAHARTALHGHISALRKALLDDSMRLVTRHGGYALLADPDALDAHRFADLVLRARTTADDEASAGLLSSALGLWRGPALADLSNVDFYQKLVGRLAEDRLAALEEFADRLLRLGRSGELIAELSAAAQAHPLRESLTKATLLALYANGRQADAMEVYHSLRRRLADELGTAPGPTVRDAYELVLSGQQLAGGATAAGGRAASTAARRGDQPTPPAAQASTSAAPASLPAQGNETRTTSRRRVSPAQLPRDAPGFTGREKELAWLSHSEQFDDQPSAGVLTVVGPPGVGKTALVLHWAHQVSDRFPDGQLYVNLRGFDETEPVQPASALASLLRSMGVPDSHIPDSLDDRAALYRTMLADQRVLVVLDNARTARQVRPLLPGTAGCAVAVTSRSRLDSLVAQDGARSIVLTPLGEVDAVALLSRTLGGSRIDAATATARELVKLCDYLPLALRVVGARLLMNPELTITELVGQLADEQRRIARLATEDQELGVGAALNVSYRLLPEPAARLFRLLGLHPGVDIDDYAAAALAGVSLPAARKLLSILLAGHLITEHMTNRFSRHDLVRLFTHQLLTETVPEDEQAAALDRLLDYYLQAGAVAAGPTISTSVTFHRPVGPPPSVPPISTAAEAFAWFHTEEPVLRAVTSMAAAQGRHEQAWQLADNVNSLYYQGGNTSDWATVSTVGLAAATTSGSSYGQMRMHSQLGVALTQRGDLEQARPHLRQALAIAETSGDQGNHYLALARLGSVEVNSGNVTEAYQFGQRALELARQMGDVRRQAQALNNCAYLMDLRGDSRAARDCAAQALALLPDRQPHPTFIAALLSYAQASRNLGDYGPALDSYTDALSEARGHGNNMLTAQCLWDVGSIRADLGQHEEARGPLQEAIEIYGRLGMAQADEVRAELADLDGSR